MQQPDHTPKLPTRPTAETGDLRYFFAGERTMLSWVRTAVSLMALGFVVARFALFLREIAQTGAILNQSTANSPQNVSTSNALHSPLPSLWIGVGLIFAGVALCGMAAREYVRFRKRFLAGEPYEIPSLFTGLALSIGLAVLGTLMAVYLVTLAQSP